MARINQDITLSHQPNLGEDVEQVAFAAGTEVTILKEWQHHYFCKNADGNVFNIRKEFVDPD